MQLLYYAFQLHMYHGIYALELVRERLLVVSIAAEPGLNHFTYIIFHRCFPLLWGFVQAGLDRVLLTILSVSFLCLTHKFWHIFCAHELHTRCFQDIWYAAIRSMHTQYKCNINLNSHDINVQRNIQIFWSWSMKPKSTILCVVCA